MLIDEPPGDDVHLDGDAEATCPYCGELTQIELDPYGGDEQEYVEDCPVCCQPWRVTVRFDEEGGATVTLEATP